jgi:hypothetical protein
MHANRAVLIAALLSGVAGPAIGCSLTVDTIGALRVGQDNTILASDVGVLTPATLTAVLPLLSGVTVDVGSPSLVQQPANYAFGTSSTQVAYDASVLGLIQLHNQPYTASPTSFSTGLLGAVTLTIVMHNRIINSAGFPSGTYGTRTVVTCHP